MHRFIFTIAGLALADACAAEVSFQKEVWPIFKRHCVACHSDKKAKGGLRMDQVAALLKGGETGALFKAGHPEESLLISQVSGEKPEMPENEPPLSAAKVRLLRDWVAQGAKIDGEPKTLLPPVVVPAVYATAPAVSSVSLSPDGKLGAAACRSEVVLFSIEDETQLRRLPTDFDLVTHVAFSPDGKQLAVAGGSPQQFGGLIVFDPASGRKLSDRHFGTDTFFKGAFAPDGRSVALGSATGAIYLIPLDPAGAPKTIELHSDWVMDVAFTPDGKQLVSGSRDKTTKLSSVEDLHLLRSVDQSAEGINAVAADGLTAISGGNARALVGYDFKLALAGISVTGSGNGAQPVSNKDKYLRAFEAQAGAVMALATSGDRKLLAVATRAAELRIYQTETRARKIVLTKVPAPVLSVALNEDGSRLVLGSKTGLVQVWDTVSGKLLKTLNPVPVQETAMLAK
jgi:WD40 repeat protein